MPESFRDSQSETQPVEDRRLTSTEIRQMISDSTLRNREHFDERIDRLEKSLTTLFCSAFPNDDPHGHRHAHEEYIKSADWWDKAKTEIILNTAKSGVWIGVIWVAYSIWEHFKEAVRR